MTTILFALLACGNPADTKPEAKVEAAKEVAPEPVGGKALAIDPAQSKVRATGSKVVGSHPIDFHDYKGTVTVEGQQVQKIEVEVQMATLKADVEKLTAHLLTADFFDVEAHPTSSFVTTSIVEKAGEDGATHEVTGNLTVRGDTKSVTFPATIAWKGDVLHANTAFSVDRQDFGIVYPGMKDNLIQDEVAMEVALVAK